VSPQVRLPDPFPMAFIGLSIANLLRKGVEILFLSKKCYFNATNENSLFLFFVSYDCFKGMVKLSSFLSTSIVFIINR
jgi:hypothetical protein